MANDFHAPESIDRCAGRSPLPTVFYQLSSLNHQLGTISGGVVCARDRDPPSVRRPVRTLKDTPFLGRHHAGQNDKWRFEASRSHSDIDQALRRSSLRRIRRLSAKIDDSRAKTGRIASLTAPSKTALYLRPTGAPRPRSNLQDSHPTPALPRSSFGALTNQGSV